MEKVLPRLHKRGLHFVICRENKAALETGWQNKAASLDSVLKHNAAGGLLGFIPGRSGLWVLDVDQFPGEGKDTGDLLTSCPGACHSRDSARPSRLLQESIEQTNRQPRLGRGRRLLRRHQGRPRLHHLVGASQAGRGAWPVAERYPYLTSPCFPNRPRAGGVLVEGKRNNALNELIFRRAQAGQTDFVEERATAIASGLGVAEVDATIKSAASAASSSTFPRKDADRARGRAWPSLAVTVRYNIRAMCPELSNGGGEWEKTTDRSSADLRRMIADKFSYRLAGARGIAPLNYGKDSWYEHLNALLYHLEVDPFKAWLKALPRSGTAQSA